MRKVIAILLLILLLAGTASAIRWPIGASTGSRTDIGEAQAGGVGSGVMQGSIFHSPVFGGKVLP